MKTKKLPQLTAAQFRLIMRIRIDPDYILVGNDWLIISDMVAVGVLKWRAPKKGTYDVTPLGNQTYLAMASPVDITREQMRRSTIDWQKKYGNRMIPLVRMFSPPDPEPIALVQEITIRKATRSFKQHVWTLRELERASLTALAAAAR